MSSPVPVIPAGVGVGQVWILKNGYLLCVGRDPVAFPGVPAALYPADTVYPSSTTYPKG